MNIIQDQPHRERALHPAHSFIVQAPAGSGKTELLTQRFLVLLKQVKQPEEILAITFTKKAAAEMRERIIQALTKASKESEPESEHGKKTWRLAKAALQQNHDQNWNLLQNPTRLRIQTMDSFNASLTRQLPILSQFGASPEIADNSELLYEEAIQEFFLLLEENTEWSDDIAQLLDHMDNDLEKVKKLLIQLLAKRDQWLPHIIENRHDTQLKNTLEKQLQEINLNILQQATQSFPKSQQEELLFLIQYAAHHLQNVEMKKITDFPGNQLKDIPSWKIIAQFLLTKEETWRKMVDKNSGFPVEGATKEEKSDLKAVKQRMTTLLQVLPEHENLRLALIDLLNAPHIEFKPNQWSTLLALHNVLHLLAAQLKIIFQRHGKIDYIENAQAAQLALGTKEEPTDLTLALDYKIHHILIDEFQDTSNSQYRLLEQLTLGWEPQDGRTLFIVGDPMQSIYRFREAEVGLFIRARKQGIGNIQLESLVLSVNFRSIPGIVEWVNQHFKNVFPTHEDISSGAISFSPSMAFKSDDMTQAVTLHPFNENENENQSAHEIISIIKKSQQNNPAGSICILVRTRNNLSSIIPALKKANISYRAIDIDPLSKRPMIQDLLSLTKAMLDYTDKLAWLSILRAPWCGLSLNDLLIISGNETDDIIWERINSTEITACLSPESQKRLKYISHVLNKKFSERLRFNLRQWIESTWMQLGGPACAANENELEDTSAFFHLLEKLDEAGEITDITQLETAIDKLYASSASVSDSAIQIMTIHNAKGLEFDTVILPCLESQLTYDDAQLLLWMEYVNKEFSSLLISPIQATYEEQDSIYDYIKYQQKIKSDYEIARLLYVAVTRARNSLHLVFNVPKSMRSSLLKQIYPSIKADIDTLLNENKSEDAPIENSINTQPLHRLSLKWSPPLQEINSTSAPAYEQDETGFILQDATAKCMGILIHKMLEYFSLHGFKQWQAKSETQQSDYIKNHLRQLNILPKNLSKAAKQVLKAISNTLNDKQGLWILQQHHDAQSEFAISTETDTFIIDRTFVDESGVRWIIDYKSSSPTDESLEKFLQQEEKEYSEQLKKYCKAFQAVEQREIKLALYFPMVPALHVIARLAPSASRSNPVSI
jgi:ATP-dependent helicase/nuclease subunit A